MKSIIKLGLILAFLIPNSKFVILHAQIYVDADATGNADGTSWSDAYIYLQDALAAASSGDEIWVAEGTYYPDEGASQTDGSRTSYFTLINDVSLYGGFTGTEISKYQASPTQNVTTLSGDIDKDGILDSDNSYHVLYADGLSAKVDLNGFTIKYGYADGSSPENQGGGFYNSDNESYLNVSNCIFEENYSSDSGGGVKNDGGSTDEMTTVFQNCIFRNNTGTGGGGVQVTASSSNTISLSFINCLFYSNYSNGNGGAIYTYSSSTTTANVYCINSTFYSNNSNWGGDAVRGGGYANHEFFNCIFWSNGNDEFSNNGNAYTTVTNSIIKLSSLPTNTTDGGNNLMNSDPLFEDAANSDFRLQDGSPAIDAGTNSADLDGSGSGTDTILSISSDLQGFPRVNDGTSIIDIGVYETLECECNHATGTNAGSSITTGVGNTIYGEEAGLSLTSGSFNSFMGYQAGYNLTTGDSSIMIGYQAGFNTTTASKNIFIGELAGYENTLGYNNYFIGKDAGYHNTTGYNNIGIGNGAGESLTTGFNNIIIGDRETTNNNMTGRDNIFMGTSSLSCTSCSYNVAIGSFSYIASAGTDLTTGNYNTLYGSSAGQDIGTGTWNTFIGMQAGANTEHASYNTFIGAYAGWDNNRTNNTSNANYNTFIGDSCGYTNREGEYNVGIGANSDANDTDYDNCTYIGADILYDASDITLIGYGAQAYKQYSVGIGHFVILNKKGAIGVGFETSIDGNYGIGIGRQDTISGKYAIGMGYQVNVADDYGIAIGNSAISNNNYSIALGSGASATGYNSVAIGYGTSVSGNHEIVFGNTSTATIGGTVDFTALSDGRYKTNIRDNIVGLDFIRQLRPVTYQLTVDGERLTVDGVYTVKRSDHQPSTVNRFSGFIAQEVEQAAKDVNFNFSGIDYREHIDKYGLRYAEFVVPLTKAIQELAPKITEQEAIIEKQSAELAKYQEELLEIMAELEKLKQN